MEIEFRAGMPIMKNRVTVRILPSLELGVVTEKDEQTHFIRMEFHWIVFGFGGIVRWPNVNYDPGKAVEF